MRDLLFINEAGTFSECPLKFSGETSNELTMLAQRAIVLMFHSVKTSPYEGGGSGLAVAVGRGTTSLPGLIGSSMLAASATRSALEMETDRPASGTLSRLTVSSVSALADSVGLTLEIASMSGETTTAGV